MKGKTYHSIDELLQDCRIEPYTPSQNMVQLTFEGRVVAYEANLWSMLSDHQVFARIRQEITRVLTSTRTKLESYTRMAGYRTWENLHSHTQRDLKVGYNKELKRSVSFRKLLAHRYQAIQAIAEREWLESQPVF